MEKYLRQLLCSSIWIQVSAAVRSVYIQAIGYLL